MRGGERSSTVTHDRPSGGDTAAGGRVIAPLTSDLVPSVADMLARAFDVDAGYRYLFPGADQTEGLADLFRRNLAVHLPHRCTWTWTEDGAPVATVTVRPPAGVPISTLTMLRHGLAPFAWARGLAATRRLLWLKRTYDALEHGIAAGSPHWHVHMMAVAPGHQGRGQGGRLLTDVLARTADLAPAPVVLTTHLDRNVTFYRRFGFEVTERRELEPPGGPSYPVWSMLRS